MGDLLWLNAETLKRAPTPLFGRLVRCSAHGCSFARLQYTQIIYTSGAYFLCCMLSIHIDGVPKWAWLQVAVTSRSVASVF